MHDYLWFLLAYVLGFFTGAWVLIVMAFWSDIKRWFGDIIWKIKLWRFR